MSVLNGYKEIKIVCQLFYPELVSTGQSMTQLAEALQREGIAVSVLCGPPTVVDTKSNYKQEMTYNGIFIKRVFSTRFPKLNTVGKLINHISFSLSVFFELIKLPSSTMLLTITNPPFLPMICALVRCLGGARFILKIADVYPDTVASVGLISKRNILYKLWEIGNKLVFKKAEKLIVLGRCMKAKIATKLSSEQKKKLVFIPIWTDDELIQENLEKLKQKENVYISKWNLMGKFVVLYTGNLGRFHDLETIIKAASILEKQEPGIHFLFVGEGYKKQWCQKTVFEQELRNCQFETYVPREDQAHVLQLAEIGLVSLDSSMIGYSVPSKTFALMAAKKAIVAIMPKQSEIALMVAEVGCGKVVNNGDVQNLVSTILQLKKDTEKRVQLGRNGAAAIQEKYSLKHAAQAYKRLF